MRFIKPQRLARVSPWVLAAACALLALIIGVFAGNNYRREKSLMTEVLVERGATLIRFVTSGARASFREGMSTGSFTGWNWSERMQGILERAAEQPDVHFLSLIDDSGIVLASSSMEKVGSRVDADSLAFLTSIEPDSRDLGRFRYRVGGSGQEPSFQVAALFIPIGARQVEEHRLWMGGGGPPGELSGRMLRHHLLPPEIVKELERIGQQKYILLVELDLAQLNKAVSQQLLQIVILSVVLLLVGVGGWLSLLTLEGLKGSQNRLQQIKAFRDILISSLPVGLIVTDKDGRIVICNQLAEQIALVRESQVVGLLPQDVLAGALAHALDGAGRKSGDSWQEERLLADRNGELRTLQLNGMSVVDNDGQPSGVMLLIQDLSQVKSLEEELRRSERMAALGKMAAGVAHELRNPLSSIKGLALLLRSRFQSGGEEQKTADILVQEVERLNRSIGELLDYARPQKLLKEAVRPEEVVQKAASLIRIDAEAIGVTIGINVDDNLPPLLADRDKLNQVFLNLFLNAIQSMEQGGQLNVGVGAEAGLIRFTIHDTGQGISKDDLPRIFDPYFTTKPEGTGLGLALSLKIVEEHGGTMMVESEPDVGTTVVVLLPCQK